MPAAHSLDGRPADGRVDGERLEGIGVARDIEVPFVFHYAAGNDAQLARALDVLASELQRLNAR